MTAESRGLLVQFYLLGFDIQCERFESCHPMNHLATGHNYFFPPPRNVCLWDTLVSSGNSLVHGKYCSEN